MSAARPCSRVLAWRGLYRVPLVTNTVSQTTNAASSAGGGGGGGSAGSSSAASRASSTSAARLHASTRPWTIVKHHQGHRSRRTSRRRGVCTGGYATDYGSGGERVSSTDNATVKHFAKLVKNRAYREECGSVVVAGAGLLEEIFAGGGEDAKVLFLADDAAAPSGVNAARTLFATEHVMKKAAGLQSVDRVDAVAELAMPPTSGGDRRPDPDVRTRVTHRGPTQ